MQQLPIQYSPDGKTVIDPRATIYRAQREEWKTRGRVTPLLLNLEAQSKALTAEMIDASTA